MALWSMVWLALGVLAGLGIFGVIGLVIAARLAARPGRSPVRRLADDELDGYFVRRAGFAVAVSVPTPMSAEQVFGRLLGRPYLSTVPLLSGPHWRTGQRGVGARRTMSGTVFSVEQEVVHQVHDRELALVGTAVCVPLVTRDFAERFVVATGESGGCVVEWTIAGTPRWVGWLPWRLLAPVARPVFTVILRHVLRPSVFRAQRAWGEVG